MKSALKLRRGSKGGKKTLMEIEEEWETAGQKYDYEDSPRDTLDGSSRDDVSAGSPWENIQMEKQRFRHI